MRILIIVAAAILSMASQAFAQNSNFYIRTGPALLQLSEKADMKVGGAVFPGGTVGVDPHFTGTIEIGYSFTKNFSIGFTGGFPPTIDIEGAGSLAGIGKLAEVTYGPTALTAQYTFTDFGPIQPYIGAGPMFMLVFDTKDALLTNFKVDPAIGAVAQAGVDFQLAETWGVYLDVKKAYLRTDATASMGGAPVTADVKLDPLVLSAGIKARF